MGAKVSANFFLNFCIFFPMVLTKLRLGFLKLKIEILMIFFFVVFVHMGPSGSEHFKTLLLQIAAKKF